MDLIETGVLKKLYKLCIINIMQNLVESIKRYLKPTNVVISNEMNEVLFLSLHKL